MTRKILYILTGILLASCSQSKTESDNYPNDISVSSIEGKPNDSLAFYYPAIVYRDSQAFVAGLDTFLLNWYSSALYSFKEPILFNYYLGHDVYRFLWLRSFHRPVVFSLHKDGNQVWLNVKALDKQPNFLNIYHVHPPPPPPIGISPKGELDATESVDSLTMSVDSVTKADRQASIILDRTIPLSKKEWRELESLLRASSFWTTKPHVESMGMDGSQWIMEGHMKGGYWFVSRWSPSDSIRSAGEYLIRLGGLGMESY